MRRLWTEPQVTFSGRHFQIHDVSLGLRPLQQGGIPIRLAGAVDNALQRVVQLGDGWFPNPSSPPSPHGHVGASAEHRSGDGT
jgi:alkanesulfonate monooxygenase SsuD/methylene tetrahydromethanopterin reductase-like flavin-dependent oxidoreductase (luciferase family)